MDLIKISDALGPLAQKLGRYENAVLGSKQLLVTGRLLVIEIRAVEEQITVHLLWFA